MRGRPSARPSRSIAMAPRACRCWRRARRAVKKRRNRATFIAYLGSARRALRASLIVSEQGTEICTSPSRLRMVDPLRCSPNLGKAVPSDAAYLEAVSRLASLALRSGVGVEQVIDQLRGITDAPTWDEGQQVLSAPDAVALALLRHARPVDENATRW